MAHRTQVEERRREPRLAPCEHGEDREARDEHRDRERRAVRQFGEAEHDRRKPREREEDGQDVDRRVAARLDVERELQAHDKRDDTDRERDDIHRREAHIGEEHVGQQRRDGYVDADD